MRAKTSLFALLVLLPCLAAAQDRWEPDIRAFEEADKASPPPSGGVVFTGSSSIVRWRLAESFPELGARAINRGFGGSVTADAVRYVDRIVVPYKPRTVVLYSGDNDLTTASTPEQIAEQFRLFVSTVRAALPRARIVIISIKPSLQRWALVDKARAANAIIARHAKAARDVAFLNVEPLMLGADGKPRPELYVEDGLHMSPEGYRTWTAALRPLLR